MANTSLDLIDAAKFFQNVAISIHNRVQDNLGKLSQSEVIDLLNKVQELASKSNLMLAQAVIQIEEESKESFESLEAAQDDINTVINKVFKVQDIIDFAAKIVSTAAAILSGDFQNIISNSENILSDVNKLLSSDNDKINDDEDPNKDNSDT